MTSSANTANPSAPVQCVGIAEIHDLLVKIISRQRVEDLTFRSDFPEPAAELASGDVWFLEDVEGWISEHGDAVADMLKTNLMARPAGRG